MAHYTNHPSPQLRNPTGLSAAPTVQRTDDSSPSAATIAKRAYEKYESRGRVDGFDLEDWTAARRELIAEASGPFSSPSLVASRQRS